ncbi:MAG: hypothetical protein ACYTG0_44275 [Planctomycetota bacterium]|jgi:hypothetical protein
MNAIEKPSDVFPECQPVLEVRDVREAIDWYAEKWVSNSISPSATPKITEHFPHS